MLRLTLVNGPYPGRSHSYEQAVISIGRSPENDCVLTDPSVSKQHGRIVAQEHGYTYQDLGSRHGSRVCYLDQLIRFEAEKDTSTCFLPHGSRLQVGETILTISIEHSESPPRETPAPGWANVQLPELLRVSDLADTLGIGQRRSSWLNVARKTRREAQEPRIANLQTQTPRSDTASERLPNFDLMQRLREGDSARLRLALDLSCRLSALHHAEDIIQRVVSTIWSLFPLTHCQEILLFDAQGRLQPFLTRLSSDAQARDVEAMRSIPLMERAVQTRSVVHYTRGQKKNGGLSEGFLQGPVCSGLYAPLFGQSTTLGVCSLTTQSSQQEYGSDDIELFGQLSATLALAIERSLLADTLGMLFEAFVNATIFIAEARQPDLEGHADRVAGYSVSLARAVDASTRKPFNRERIDGREQRMLHTCARLHSFGIAPLPEAALVKRRRLSDERLRLLRQQCAWAKQQARCELHEAFLAELHAAQRCPDSEELLSLDACAQARAAELDELLQLVEVNRTVRELDRKALERIEELNSEYALLREPDLLELRAEPDDPGPKVRQRRAQLLARAARFLRLVPWNAELRELPWVLACAFGAPPDDLTPAELQRARLFGHIILLAHRFDHELLADGPEAPAHLTRALVRLELDARKGTLPSALVTLFLNEVAPKLSDGL